MPIVAAAVSSSPSLTFSVNELLLLLLLRLLLLQPSEPCWLLVGSAIPSLAWPNCVLAELEARPNYTVTGCELSQQNTEEAEMGGMLCWGSGYSTVSKREEEGLVRMNFEGW